MEEEQITQEQVEKWRKHEEKYKQRLIKELKPYFTDKFWKKFERWEIKHLEFLEEVLDNLKFVIEKQTKPAEQEESEEESDEDKEEQEEETPKQEIEILYNPVTDEPPFEDDVYIKSEKCFCDKPKFYGAKGCEEHKKEADKLRKRLGISMEDAWKEVWKNYG